MQELPPLALLARSGCKNVLLEEEKKKKNEIVLKEARAAPLVVSESTKSKKYTYIYPEPDGNYRGPGLRSAALSYTVHCTALHCTGTGQSQRCRR